jgi:tryptophan 2,3-dioxygenase
MVQSLTMEQVTSSLNSLDSRATVVSSANTSIQAVKNKRKSDYMEMRDRLRKPSMMAKIGK